MVLPLSRSLHVTFVVLTIAVLTGAVFGALAQPGVQDPPLFRNEATSSIGEHKPNAVLSSLANPIWIMKGDALEFTFHYKCLREDAYGGTSGDQEQLDPNCNIGTAGQVSVNPRTVELFYNTTGAEPRTGGDDPDPSITLSTAGRVAVGGYNSETFTGTLPATVLEGMTEGTSLGFVVRVPLSNADVGCDGEGNGGSITCFDPRHTTQEPYYQVRVDDSTPKAVLSEPVTSQGPNGVRKQLDESQWYLYSTTEMSSQHPSITVSIVDNLTGAPIDLETVRLFVRGNETNLETNWDYTKVSDWGHSYFYKGGSTGAITFETDTATRVDVVAEDLTGHTIDTRGTGTHPAVWVVMDNSTPELQVASNDQGNAGSYMKRASGATGLAALGEEMRIYVNATDVGARKTDNSILNTPKEHLEVTLRFQGGPDNQTFSDPITIPYNETACDCFHSATAAIPMDWVNGVTWANITVTDPVGHAVSNGIQGSVNVDVEIPQVVPLDPIGTTVSTDFTRDATVTFIARVTDPGDEDEWDGAQTDDTDFFGIDLDNVRVRYMIGENGVLRTGKMNPQQAESTFQWINTFGSEDPVYYFIEAKDLAGNTATYPAATDEHVTLNSTHNGGRFLFLQIDKQGPSITPAKDLDWLGKGPHEFSFEVVDGGIGVNEQAVDLFWRPGTSGAFQELQLTKDPQNASIYKGSIPTQEDGAKVQYYVAADDLLGNAATLGSVGSPRTATIDLTAPSVTVNAPETTTESTFNVTWSATDTGSGVKDYTLQFRIAPGGDWFTVPSRTETDLAFYELCAATGKTYEFRVSARDRAGNERGFPESADASTFVDAATSCAKAPEVTIQNPEQGATLSGQIGFDWSAVSTTSPGDLSVSLLIGTGSEFQTIESGLSDQGTYTWNSASLDVTVLCVPDGAYTIRVLAADPNGLEGTANVGPVTIQNGIADCDDRDSDGLPDAWEAAQFGDLSQGPDGDTDGDGSTNLEEFRANTDPNDDTSTPPIGGTNNGGAVTIAGWSNAYILVILGFIAVLAVFVIGMTRRW